MCYIKSIFDGNVRAVFSKYNISDNLQKILNRDNPLVLEIQLKQVNQIYRYPLCIKLFY